MLTVRDGEKLLVIIAPTSLSASMYRRTGGEAAQSSGSRTELRFLGEDQRRRVWSNIPEDEEEQ